MDYNPRMSMARSSQQSSQQRQKKEEPEDAFMTLPDREIAGCITDIGISFTIQDLQKPNPQQIQKVFEFLNEILTSTTRETVAPAMKAAADDLCGDEAERVFTADTRELMGFFVMLRKALMEVSAIVPLAMSKTLYADRHDCSAVSPTSPSPISIDPPTRVLSEYSHTSSTSSAFGNRKRR
ncbi:kinetochore-associated Ndc80 complex subunit nuf2 [Elasticomyces elasticus]|nr:kinetochore-associated Ndc80 complex subunit nuf2 [Elasticomyces elasticus]